MPLRAVFSALWFTAIACAASPLAAEPDLAAYLKSANAGLRRVVLENGMVLLLKEDHSAPVAAVQIWVGTGSIHEEQSLGAGLSHYMEHMIFKGTDTRGPADITREIDNAGGEINAYTSTDRTVFHVVLPAAHWKTAASVLADALMHARLPEEEWGREKEVILREFAMGEDDPERVINKLLYATAYHVHPYKFPIIGHEAVFRTMTRDDLAAFYRHHYVPDNMLLVAVGDFSAGEAEAFFREQFKDFPRRARAPVFVPAEPPQIAPRFARRTGPYNDTRLEWCVHTVGLSHPDAAALDVLSYIVGQGRSSRLTAELQEKLKLVFRINAWSHTPKDPGLFGISAAFAPDREPAVLAALSREIASWSERPFAEEEISKAKRALLAHELSQLQTMDGQAGNVASGEFYAGDPRYSETYVEQVQRVTAADLDRAVRAYLGPRGRTLVLLTPADGRTDAIAATDAAPVILEPVKRELAGGIPLIVREDHRLPFVHVCVGLKGGLLFENEAHNGITHLFSDLLTRGTATRSAEEIAQTVESMGASLTPFAGMNSFGLAGRCLTGDVETFLDLFADCLLHPVFPDSELDKQREIQKAALRRRLEDPFFLAADSLKQALFPDHPYRFNSEGTEESLTAISRPDLLAYHGAHVQRANLVVAMFGDITADHAQRLADRVLADTPAGKPLTRSLIAKAPALPQRLTRHEPKAQTLLLAGYPGVDVKDPRADALEIIKETLSGLSSDLGIEVREKRGLVYYVGAFQRTGLEPGFFALYAGTRPEAAAEVESLMEEQIQRILRGGLRDEELGRGREQLIARHQMSLQDNGGLAQTCALNELYGLGFDYSFATEDRIRTIRAEDLREAAASIFKPERRAVSILLPEPSKETQP